MSGQPPFIHETGRDQFQNWHETYKVNLRRIVDVWNGEPERHTLSGYKATTAGLQRLIKQSMDVGERIRALGGGWSFSRAASVNGTLVNTKPLNYKFRVGTSAVRTGFKGKRKNLYFVQCGNSIAELNWYLFSQKKSLPTSGASNGQTIGGALSTGTHGSAIDFGAIPEFVVAIHLIVSPTRHVWLERESNPVIRDSKLPDKIGAQVIRDDALFNAALVSFGSLGIIHGVVIEASNKYFLSVFRRKLRRSNALRATMEDLDISRLNFPGPNARPYHFSTLINPYDPDFVYVTAMYRSSTMPANADPIDPPSPVTPGDDALGVVAALTDLFGDLGPILAGPVLASAQGDVTNQAGTPGQVFRDTTTRGKAASSAMGMPLDRVNEVIDLLLELHEEVDAPVFLASRYVKSTQATLGFTSYGERTAIVEIDGPGSSKVRDMHQEAWKLMRSEGIPHTFHWGKQHNLTGPRVRQAYGDSRVDAWIGARHSLLRSQNLRATFANGMVIGAGLNQ